MILALDTSLGSLRVGLYDMSAQRIDLVTINPNGDERGLHDRLLAHTVDEIMKKHSVRVDLITSIALIIGPGSFMGLRIGLAFAKGIAYITGADLIPLSAHCVMANEYRGNAPATLVYPGYERGKCYVASTDDPTVIHHVPIAELTGKIAGESSMASAFASFTVLPLSLDTMAHLALSAEASPDIASLEPLYITEFVPKVH